MNKYPKDVKRLFLLLALFALIILLFSAWPYIKLACILPA